MVEKEIVQARGFRNTRDAKGNVDGFQFRIKTGYYKGIWLSQFRVGDAKVDGETIAREDVIWEINGIEYTPDEMLLIGDTYWQVATPATVKIRRPGGLEQGYHTVGVSFGWYCNYQAPERCHPQLGTNWAGYYWERELLLV
ncbi:MAG: DUF6379 domain-containing protein [Propionibacteriaceae bacterium]|jgi:hypothetical protein|nr:DUF6379 domain-containing protein [Propionibacteriaceae bacterium]